MQTLTLSKARQNLGRYVRRAIEGNDVGLLCDGHIVALRPVEVYSEDYALREYGATPEQLDRVISRIKHEKEEARQQGQLVVFNGSLKECCGPDSSPVPTGSKKTNGRRVRER